MVGILLISKKIIGLHHYFGSCEGAETVLYICDFYEVTYVHMAFFKASIALFCYQKLVRLKEFNSLLV